MCNDSSSGRHYAPLCGVEHTDLGILGLQLLPHPFMYALCDNVNIIYMYNTGYILFFGKSFIGCLPALYLCTWATSIAVWVKQLEHSPSV